MNNNIIENSKDGKDFLKINELILRTQSIARYNNINKGHFGLSLKNILSQVLQPNFSCSGNGVGKQPILKILSLYQSSSSG